MRDTSRHLDDAILLLSAPALIPLWKYYAKASGLPAFGGPLDPFWRGLLEFALFFALFGLLPGLDQRLRRQGPLVDAGLGLGDRRFGIQALAGGLPLVLMVAWLGAQMPEVRGEYPMCRLLLDRRDLFLPYVVSYALLYYLAWEFYFRGYLLFALASRFGPVSAVLLQTVPSALAHLGKPSGEMFGSIPFGVAVGFLALRTRSIWYGWLLHAALGVSTDWFVIAHG